MVAGAYENGRVLRRARSIPVRSYSVYFTVNAVLCGAASLTETSAV